MRFFKDLLTGPDDQTYEIAHIMWFVGVISFVVLATYTVFKNGQYPNGFGTDFMTLNAGGAAGAYGRAKADQSKDTP